MRSPSVPQAGCRGRSPAGGTASPPVPNIVGGWARWDNGARHHEPPPSCRMSTFVLGYRQPVGRRPTPSLSRVAASCRVSGIWQAGEQMVKQWPGDPFPVRRRITAARRPRHSYATATGHLPSGAGWEVDKGVANRARGGTTVTPGCAGLATSLVPLLHWQSRLYAQTGEFPTSAAAGRIASPAGVAVPAPVLGRRLGSAPEW